MPIDPKVYDAICKRECEWCAKGFAQYDMGPVHHWIPRNSMYLGSNEVRCTAPTRDQVIERQAAELARQAEALRVARDALTGIAGCEPTTLDTASRIARRALAALDQPAATGETEITGGDSGCGRIKGPPAPQAEPREWRVADTNDFGTRMPDEATARHYVKCWSGPRASALRVQYSADGGKNWINGMAT